MKVERINHRWPSDRKRNVFLEDLRMLTRSSYWDYFDNETKGIILTQLGVHHGYYKTNG